MRIITIEKDQRISIEALHRLGEEFYEDLVVGAIDISSERVAFGGEYNNDPRSRLVESGSRMEDVWGFKVMLPHTDEHYLAASLTDIRPGEGNPSLVSDNVREKIREMVESKIADRSINYLR